MESITVDELKKSVWILIRNIVDVRNDEKKQLWVLFLELKRFQWIKFLIT